MKWLELKNLQKYTKIVFLLFIGFYMFVPTYLFNHMQSMGHVHSHNASNECLYASGGNTICNMDLFNKMADWQNSLSHMTESKAYFGFVFVPIFLVIFIIIRSIKLNYFYLKRQKFKSTVFLYTQLFSRGILNPKTY